MTEEIVSVQEEEIEVVNFFSNQKENRSTRTSPTTEAKAPKPTGTNKKTPQTMSQLNLDEHVKNHAFQCAECDKTFKTKGLINRQMKEEHNIQPKGTQQESRNPQAQNSVKVFQCDACDFKGKSYIQIQIMKIKSN